MAHIAEYLGRRTDVSADPQLKFVSSGASAKCPFKLGNCKKRGQPICSVRDSSNKLWITCEHRLCATPKNVALVQYQKDILYDVAETIFYSGISKSNVFIDREVAMPVVTGGSYKADYVMKTNDPVIVGGLGPHQVVLEMQGGGETSNTQKLTKVASDWGKKGSGINKLRQNESSVGAIVTNAWRRQQEQFIVKGNIAMLSSKGSAMVFCVGTLLYDYLWDKVKSSGISSLKGYNWTLALVEFEENVGGYPMPGPVPLKVGRTLFTNYQNFVRALTDQGEPAPQIFDSAKLDLT